MLQIRDNLLDVPQRNERKEIIIKYAEDLDVISKTKTQPQKMIIGVVEVGRRYGLQININKSKVM